LEALNKPALSHVAKLDPGSVVYAIGDIHGRLDLLQALTGELRRAAGSETLTAVFLGDYIDRGPDARGVIDHLVAFRDAKVCESVFLRGNHEQFLLDIIDGKAADDSTWLDYGGLDTLASYGVEWPPARGQRSSERLAELVREALPPEHVRFLRETALKYPRGDFMFVHAGLRPDRLLSEQSDSDMMWFRYYADDQPVHGKTVVHGHTPRGRPVAGRWRIGVDTEAWTSGVLTALRLEGAQRGFIKIEAGANGAAPSVGEWEDVELSRDRPPPPTAKARRRRAARGERPGRRTLIAAGAAAVLVLAALLTAAAWRLGSTPDTPPPPAAAPAT
jgi:serine/threonine protein phosphatase 1